MIENYKEVLKKVYDLAKVRSNEYFKGSNDIEFINLLYVEDDYNDTSGLLQYLQSLDEEAIKVIQSVMYMGREHETETEDEYNIRMLHIHDYPNDKIAPPPLTSDDPEELLQKWIHNTSAGARWHGLNIEINQIYEKMPLDIYLERAFSILGI